MSCCSTSRNLVSIYLLLVINSVLLCCCYLLYTLDWMRHTTTCGQSGIIISYVTASSSLFYGIVSIVTTAIFCFHLVNSKRNPRSYCMAAIALSCVCLLYTTASAVIMYISLYMKFNTSCFKDGTEQADAAYMGVVCGYNLISYFLLLLVTILLLDSVPYAEHHSTTNQKL